MKKERLYISSSYTKKLISIFVLVLAIPLLANEVVSFVNSRKMIEDKTFDYLNSLSSVTMSEVDRSVQNILDTVFFISGNEQIQEILRENLKEDSRDRIYRNYSEARSLLSYYVLLSGEISSAYILQQDGSMIGYAKSHDVPDAETAAGMQTGWNLIGDSLYLKRDILSYKDQSLLSELVVGVNTPVFYSLVKEIFTDPESEAFLVDEGNHIIASGLPEKTGDLLDPAYLAEGQDLSSLAKVTIDGKNMGIHVNDSSLTDWRLVLAIPESYFMQDVWTLRTFHNTLFIATELVTVLIIIFLGNRMTRSINILSDAMEQVGQGNFDVRAEVIEKDEMGVLCETFNQMVEDMRMLIDDNYRQKMMKQEIEMRSLQMQINPHFLYNTLDTISWSARMNGMKEISDMTTALGGLMRYSLSDRDFVTVAEELEKLQYYINIQNVRYGDRMDIVVDAEEEVMDCYIPKLLIQPILENAIVHGIEDKIDKGLIEIKCYAEEDDLYIVVSDDGVGMTQEAIEALMGIGPAPAEKAKGHTSIGVYNVNRRIQAVFGPSCGLQVQSELGAGTTIRLHMKKMTEIPDMNMRYDL